MTDDAALVKRLNLAADEWASRHTFLSGLIRAAASAIERLVAERDEAKQGWDRVLAELERTIKVLAGTNDTTAAVRACQPCASDCAARVVAERDNWREEVRKMTLNRDYQREQREAAAQQETIRRVLHLVTCDTAHEDRGLTLFLVKWEAEAALKEQS